MAGVIYVKHKDFSYVDTSYVFYHSKNYKDYFNNYKIASKLEKEKDSLLNMIQQHKNKINPNVLREIQEFYREGRQNNESQKFLSELNDFSKTYNKQLENFARTLTSRMLEAAKKTGEDFSDYIMADTSTGIVSFGGASLANISQIINVLEDGSIMVVEQSVIDNINSLIKACGRLMNQSQKSSMTKQDLYIFSQQLEQLKNELEEVKNSNEIRKEQSSKINFNELRSGQAIHNILEMLKKWYQIILPYYCNPNLIGDLGEYMVAFAGAIAAESVQNIKAEGFNTIQHAFDSSKISKNRLEKIGFKIKSTLNKADNKRYYVDISSVTGQVQQKIDVTLHLKQMPDLPLSFSAKNYKKSTIEDRGVELQNSSIIIFMNNYLQTLNHVININADRPKTMKANEDFQKTPPLIKKALNLTRLMVLATAALGSGLNERHPDFLFINVRSGNGSNIALIPIAQFMEQICQLIDNEDEDITKMLIQNTKIKDTSLKFKRTWTQTTTKDGTKLTFPNRNIAQSKSLEIYQKLKEKKFRVSLKMSQIERYFLFLT